ncbi:MAG: pyridoxal 5'-phosphate synthase glutaminase subunit PdxT [Chloroflexota bacterium]|nr:pyridoxal 5'-phosphate synthase glutaminase subunit PdxT [Chloroflexota bacterium]
MKIGILSLQGGFAEHISLLSQLGQDVSSVRCADDLCGLDGLVIPGGESTTIVNLINSYGLLKPLRDMARAGLPIMGTCAGLIVLGRDGSDRPLETLEVMDVTVLRNAFGRQVDSFEVDLKIAVLGRIPFRCIFIRAPIIQEVGHRVEVLAHLSDGTPVAVLDGNLLGVSFHPELTSDMRFHEYFLTIVDRKKRM